MMNTDIIEISEYIRETCHEDDDNDELKYRIVGTLESIENNISKIILLLMSKKKWEVAFDTISHFVKSIKFL